jgi:hypothetical protein
MKPLFLTALAAFVPGCTASNEPAPANDAPTLPARHVAPPLEGTPVAADLDESLGVFVMANTNEGGDGTRARPFATIRDAIASAKPTKKRVYVCEGTFRESFEIADGISMVGGLDCSIATWAIGNGRSHIVSPESRAIAAKAIKSPTRFERFDVSASDANEPGGSSMALFAQDSSALLVSNSRFVAGNGVKGADGVEPAPTVVTGDIDGRGGMSSREYCWWTADKNCATTFERESGGSGGFIKCNGVAGNSGGTGGSGGVWQSTLAPGGLSRTWTVYANDPATFGPTDGASGVPLLVAGTNGASAKAHGTFDRDGYSPANGTRGTDGFAGRSGAGGAGAAPMHSAENQNVWFGVHGSGGGAGGCGGIAGTAGGGGGASIAALVIDGALTFVDVELVSKNGGAGGKGTFGSDSTPGGKGGPMVDTYIPSQGRAGGPGSSAGLSGSGGGGSSFALFHLGPLPRIEGTTSFVIGEAGAGVAEIVRNAEVKIAASTAGEAAPIAGVVY